MWRSSSSSPENISTSERGRRKIFYRDVLKAYFKALEKADELGPRVNPSDKRHWQYDSEEAEAYLVIKLSADMTVKQAVRESRESSGK
jgi:hypothetical protein